MTAFNHSQEENYQPSEATNSQQQQSKDMRHQKKSIFGIKTFWGVVFTSTAAIAPIVGNNVDTVMQNKKEPVNYGQDAAQIVVIICGAAASIMGRVEAKSAVYTPKWMPGPNIKDFDSE